MEQLISQLQATQAVLNQTATDNLNLRIQVHSLTQAVEVLQKRVKELTPEAAPEPEPEPEPKPPLVPEVVN